MMFSGAIDLPTSSCPQGNAPVLPEAKSTGQNTYRIPDKCSHKELVFSITQCTGTKMVCMCNEGMFMCERETEECLKFIDH